MISPQDFFDKCYNGTLQESDFNFIKRNQDEKSGKGSVRRKIKVLPNMTSLFKNDFVVQETFIKNKITCTFATTDGECTVGFINTTSSRSRPRSLIKGDEIDDSKSGKVSLLLRKKSNKEKFDEIIIGDKAVLVQYYEMLKDYIDESLIIDNAEDEVASANE